MQNRIERFLELLLSQPFYLGQLLVRKTATGGFIVSNRDDEMQDQPQIFLHAEDAIEISRCDDAGRYRPLKTAPNMRHGWQLDLATASELRCALDYFYPGRLAIFAAWESGNLQTTSLRDTLERQSGMYHVAAKISDAQIDDLVADFCRSNGGCLRTILWKRDALGTIASTKLPTEKFDPACDQVSALNHQVSTAHATVPLLCQEACNLLVVECRRVVKGENADL